MEQNLLPELWFIVYMGESMKLTVAVVVILFGAALATAQKKDPMVRRSYSNQPAHSARSFGPDAVNAVLNTKSSTASQLTKIEHPPANHPSASKSAAAHPPLAKSFGVGQENKNKPMRASRPGGATAHTPVRRKTG